MREVLGPSCEPPCLCCVDERGQDAHGHNERAEDQSRNDVFVTRGFSPIIRLVMGEQKGDTDYENADDVDRNRDPDAGFEWVVHAAPFLVGCGLA